jgi:hypothetical protein
MWARCVRCSVKVVMRHGIPLSARNVSNVNTVKGHCPLSYINAYRNWIGKSGIREWRLAPHNGLNRISPILCCYDESRASFRYDGKHPMYVSV